ncbi:MAG: monovalent cation/H+ antiporter complex subunit F [Pseudomonadota bacterium]
MIIIRAWRGPTLFDRILTVNNFGTAIVLLICVLGFYVERFDFVDIALGYSLVNFIATMAILKLYRFDDLGHNEEEDA